MNGEIDELIEQLHIPLRVPPLPQRLDTKCGYCGRADCTERWEHDRWNRANEDTWRRR